MHKILLILAFVRENKNLMISLAALALFMVFGIMSFIRIGELSTDLDVHKAQVLALRDKVANYEAEIEKNEILGADIEELIGENDVLNDKIAGLTEKNEELAAANNELTEMNDDLAAANGELERQNGELTKKLNGLKPN